MLFSLILFASCNKNKPIQAYFVVSHSVDYDGAIVFVDDIKIISNKDATKIIYINSPSNEYDIKYGNTTLPDAEVIELLSGTYTVEYKIFNKNGYGTKLNEKTIHKQITIESGSSPMYSIIGKEFNQYDSKVKDSYEATEFIQKKVDEKNYTLDSLAIEEMNRLDNISDSIENLYK